nr:distal membrane-arm assembly complex protein 2 [Onthophagus taurus]
MFKALRSTRNKLNSPLICGYCTSNEKHTSKMPSDLVKQTDITSKSELDKMKEDVKSLKWRSTWHEKEGQYYSTLRTFYTEHNNSAVMKFIQSPIKLWPSDIKKWWAGKQEEKSIIMQQYIPARNQMLGNELAAAHFVVHRGGSVKFFGQDFWIKRNDMKQYNLPKKYDPDWFLQAIDCNDMELYYEGLVNMRDLQNVEWFSISGCENMDDWCLDRIANIFSKSLLYLDIRDCPNITFRGLGALVKMEKLKILYVNNIIISDEWEMTCLLLQEVNPKLDIRT